MGPFPGGLVTGTVGGGVLDGRSELGRLGGGRVAALSGLGGGSCNDTPGLPADMGLGELAALLSCGIVDE